MKLKAWDKKRRQFVPQEDFALVGDGRLLIAYTTNEDLWLSREAGCDPPISGWGESAEVFSKDIEITVEEV